MVPGQEYIPLAPEFDLGGHVNDHLEEQAAWDPDTWENEGSMAGISFGDESSVTHSFVDEESAGHDDAAGEGQPWVAEDDLAHYEGMSN